MSKTNIFKYDAKTLAIHAHSLGLDLDDLEHKFVLIKRQSGYIERLSMPVININQIKKLQKLLRKVNIDYRQIYIPTHKLKPVQKEIYLEKAIDLIDCYGYYELKADLCRNASVIISKDLYIVDGHHRWLASMLMKPSLGIKVLQIGLRFTELYRPMLAYSNFLQNKRKE